MILEAAVLTVRPGQETAFESAMRNARPLIAATPGFMSISVRRCVETRNRYLLLVTWRTLEDHTTGFRHSERYQHWRDLLHQFYDPFPTVEHFEDAIELEIVEDADPQATHRTNVEIVTYGEEHFGAVNALWEEAFRDDQPWNKAANAIPAKLAFQPNLFFVALDGKCVVGSIMAGYDGHRGWVNRIAVLESHRGRGVGSALVRDAERRLRTMGCAKINVQVRASNVTATKFYERLGYSVEDRISMSKRIIAQI